MIIIQFLFQLGMQLNFVGIWFSPLKNKNQNFDTNFVWNEEMTESNQFVLFYSFWKFTPLLNSNFVEQFDHFHFWIGLHQLYNEEVDRVSGHIVEEGCYVSLNSVAELILCIIKWLNLHARLILNTNWVE